MNLDESALRKAVRENPTDQSYRLLLADYLCENGRERDGILERVHAQPDNDDWREQYATWCERNGDTARAELIRVQLSLKEFKRGPCNTERHQEYKDRLGIKYDSMSVYLHTLLTVHADRWRKGPVCEKCVNGYEKRPQTGEVIEQWCHHCDRTCDAGGLTMILGDCNAEWDSAEGWFHIVDYVRGMKRVHATLAECVQEVPDHDNNCRCTVPSNWLRSVLTHHPDVVEMWVTDVVQSREYGGGDDRWAIYRSAIPGALWGVLCPGSDPEDAYIERHNRDEIVIALARAVVRWGRSFL